MVSTHTYCSFKEVSGLKIKPFQILIGFLLLFILVAAEPQIMIFSLFLIYLASGPVYGLVKKIRASKKLSLSFKKKEH
jgi:CDP-diacylglycerol--serine O-phosphatidyltransferase